MCVEPALQLVTSSVDRPSNQLPSFRLREQEFGMDGPRFIFTSSLGAIVVYFMMDRDWMGMNEWMDGWMVDELFGVWMEFDLEFGRWIRISNLAPNRDVCRSGTDEDDVIGVSPRESKIQTIPQFLTIHTMKSWGWGVSRRRPLYAQCCGVGIAAAASAAVTGVAAWVPTAATTSGRHMQQRHRPISPPPHCCCSVGWNPHNVLCKASTRDEDIHDNMDGVSLSLFIQPDYLITDSLDLIDRPDLLSFLLTPRNLLGLSLVGTGLALTVYNVVGAYNDDYLLLQQVSIGLAIANAALDYPPAMAAIAATAPRFSWSLGTPTASMASQQPQQPSMAASPETDPRRGISHNIRCGCIDDASVHWYSATYTLATAWLALRTSVACPASLGAWDKLLGPLAVIVFVYSIAAPSLTLLHHYKVYDFNGTLQFLVRLTRGKTDTEISTGNRENRTSNAWPDPFPPLSELELFRAQALLAIGIIGCIFAPEAATLAVRDAEWWPRVMDVYPGQAWIESTNALFGVYATQSSMVAHRAGKLGVAPYAVIVPIFTLVCFALTILPSACSLYWWGDQISFFDFYTK